LEYEIDEKEYEDKKKPWRYRWPAEVREEVLARLLELNKKRAEEEQLMGEAAAKSSRAGNLPDERVPLAKRGAKTARPAKKPKLDVADMFDPKK
jgi:hypothetical protein